MSTLITPSWWQIELVPTIGDQLMARLFDRVDVICPTQGITNKGSVWLGFPYVSKVYNSKQKGQSIQTITIIHAMILEPSVYPFHHK